MKKLVSMSIFASFLAFMGCSHQKQDKFLSVSVDEFEQLISDTSVIRLDVRTAEEFAEGHIEKAVNIDVKQGSFEQEALEKLDKNSTVALYCRSGRRSKIAAEKLADAGYNVVELDKGYTGWTEAGHSTKQPNNQTTK